jgi:hypothetical protein
VKGDIESRLATYKSRVLLVLLTVISILLVISLIGHWPAGVTAVGALLANVSGFVAQVLTSTIIGLLVAGLTNLLICIRSIEKTLRTNATPAPTPEPNRLTLCELMKKNNTIHNWE